MLNDVEFREVQEITRIDKIKIVACDGKSKKYYVAIYTVSIMLCYIAAFCFRHQGYVKLVVSQKLLLEHKSSGSIFWDCRALTSKSSNKCRSESFNLIVIKYQILCKTLNMIHTLKTDRYIV